MYEQNSDAEGVKYIPTKNGELIPEKTIGLKSDTPFLFFINITVTAVGLSCGGMFTWTSPALVVYLSNDTNINPLGKPVTAIEISLLTGAPALFGMFASLLISPVTDWMGRKKTIQLLALGAAINILITAFANDIIVLIIIRCVFFMFFYAILAVIPIYISEICEDHNRAKYGCRAAMCLVLGSLYTYIFGSYFSIRVYTLLILVPLVFFLIFFTFAPESPVYSLSKNRRNECLKALQKLRSNKTGTEIEFDLDKIQESLNLIKSTKNVGLITLFKSKLGRIGLLISLVPILTQFVCGVLFIMPLLAPIFNEAGTNISGNLIAIVAGSAKVFCYIITSNWVEKFGRKPLLLVSSIGTVVTMGALGLFFVLKYYNSSLVVYLQWLPPTALILYIIFYACGLGPIPPAILSEFFTSDTRSTAVGFIYSLCAIIALILGMGFPIVKECIGLHWCFWIFGCNSLVGAIFIWKMLPETTGKSIDEIQEILSKY